MTDPSPSAGLTSAFAGGVLCATTAAGATWLIMLVSGGRLAAGVAVIASVVTWIVIGVPSAAAGLAALTQVDPTDTGHAEPAVLGLIGLGLTGLAMPVNLGLAVVLY